MSLEFILAQICGFFVLIFMVISVWFNENKKIIFFSIIANTFAAAQYFLLWALTGAVISIINTIRCIVFYYYKKKNLKPSLVILILFETVAIVSGAITWQNWWSLIPIIITVVYTYGIWQDKTFIIKLSTGIAGAGWLVYNTVVKAYVGALQGFLQFMSSIIAIIKDKIKKSKLKLQSNETKNNEDFNEESTPNDIETK